MSKRKIHKNQANLKIFYDLSFVGHGRISGIERFSLEIYHHLTNTEGMIFICALPKGFGTINPSVNNFFLASKSKLLNHFIYTPLFLLKFSPDIAIFPAFPPAPYLVEFQQIKIFRVLHDVVFWQRPETLSTKAVWYLKPLENFWLKHYKRLLTVSNYSKNKIVQVLGFKETDIFIVPNGVSKIFREESTFNDKISKKYLLCVSTIEPRKNLTFLIDVFDQLSLERNDLDLIICGRKGWGFNDLIHRVSKSPNANNIYIIHDANDKKLAKLYAGATLFVFPSLEEGFGIPILEAMSQGKVVIASDNSAISEVVGKAGILVQDYCPNHWSKTIIKILADKSELERIKKLAKYRAAEFTWKKSVEKLKEAIKHGATQELSY